MATFARPNRSKPIGSDSEKFRLAVALPGNIEDNGKRAAVLIIAMILIIVLSYFTERQKDRLKSCLIALGTAIEQARGVSALKRGPQARP